MIETLITGAFAVVVCMINNFFQRRSSEKQHQATVEAANKQYQATMKAAEEQHNTTIALIEYKLDQLTHKVDLHNNAVERLYEVEKVLGIQEEQIKVANHRIEDLEHGEN